VGAGTHSTCALLEEGAGEDSLWCWGNNASQQLIQALDAAGKYNLPVQVPGDHQWAPLRRVDDSRRPGQMNGGSGHFCALYAEGEVTSLFCAGSNSAGQLGVVSEERVVGNVVCPISPEPGEGEGGGEGEGEGREPGCQEDLEQCLSVCRRKCDSNTSPYGICVDHCNGGQVDLVGYGECMLSIDCNVEGSGGDRWDWSVLENCAADNPRQAEDPCE